MKYPSPTRLGIILICSVAFGQEKVQKLPINATSANSGSAMFLSYCASCHGANGKGGGPAAAALRGSVPDLTLLAKSHGGVFPSQQVMMTLGRIPSAGAHGNADMPVWGDVFRQSRDAESIVQMRLYNLTQFVESLQDPSVRQPMPATKDEMPTSLLALPANSGPEMYRWLCAGCHGAEGKGDGPALSSLKSRPTDLTQLSKAHQGQFPSLSLTNMLDKDPGTSAHGSKDMPIWGNSFRGSGENPAVVRLRIRNLVDHIKKLQTP